MNAFILLINLRYGNSKKSFKFSAKHILLSRAFGRQGNFKLSQMLFCIAVEVILQILVAFICLHVANSHGHKNHIQRLSFPHSWEEFTDIL